MIQPQANLNATFLEEINMYFDTEIVDTLNDIATHIIEEANGAFILKMS